MKNKNKISSLKKSVVILLFFSCLLAGFFVLENDAIAEDKTIIISAVQTSGQTANDDFIELYNNTCADIELTNWKIKRRTASGSESIIGSLKNTIPGKGYFLWKNISANSVGNPDYATTSYSLSDNYSIALFDSTNAQVDALTWGNNLLPFADTPYYPLNLKAFETILRNLSDETSIQLNYAPKNSSVLKTEELSSCTIEDPAPDPIDPSPAEIYSDQLRLNEILPNPKDDETTGEFIELYNAEDFPIDLENWGLQDSSDTQFIFPAGYIIGANDYLTIYRDIFRFALNNSGQEDIYLLNPNGDTVSEITYENAKENVSFSFDEADWKWTKYLTPDKANEFDAVSQIKAEHIKEGFVVFPIEFSLDPDFADFSKVVWNFGDTKKSYLKNPKHTYLKKGNYTVTVSTSGEAEDTSDSFVLKIKDYPREKVEIVGLIPNPLGTDAEQEWIEIKNNEKNVVNLKGWKLATGKKVLVNHPIKDDFEIQPGETAQLTREQAFFTLHNKAMILELRYPDGKTADRVSYSKETIGDDELYSKESGRWTWISAEGDERAAEDISEPIEAPVQTEPESEPVPEEALIEIVEAVLEESPENMGKFSVSNEWQAKRKNWLNYLAYGLPTNTSPKLASENIALQEKSQPATSNQKVSTKNIFLQINSFLNSVL
ncbi:MAG: lamin tail domain-containing protein [Candidatus Moranbacteria bacterium]|nr:lamin tail domain-containing protein [Candidatus Moranbacteria bacterium]